MFSHEELGTLLHKIIAYHLENLVLLHRLSRDILSISSIAQKSLLLYISSSISVLIVAAFAI